MKPRRVQSCACVKQNVAGPPGFEPGTLPQEGLLACFFSGGFPWVQRMPRGKSVTDTALASPMLYLTELRAPRVPKRFEIKRFCLA